MHPKRTAQRTAQSLCITRDRRLNRCAVRCVTVWNGIKVKRISILFIYAPFFIKNVKMTSFLPLHPLYLINVALHPFYMAAEFGFFCRWQLPSQTWFCIILCLNVHTIYFMSVIIFVYFIISFKYAFERGCDV